MPTFLPYRRPITLNLQCETGVRRPTTSAVDVRSTGSIPSVVIPTDLMLAAFRHLFPAERMVMLAGRRLGNRVTLTSFADVTERTPSAVHVRACPQKLAQALLDFERCGAHLALWLHSHPGTGALATHPSDIDRSQERLLRDHYSNQLLSAIAVADGHLRFWGGTPADRASLIWEGTGVYSCPHNHDVYKLAAQV